MNQHDRRLAFSKRRLEALPVTADRRVFYHDSTTPGLLLQVTPNGARASTSASGRKAARVESAWVASRK